MEQVEILLLWGEFATSNNIITYSNTRGQLVRRVVIQW